MIDKTKWAKLLNDHTFLNKLSLGELEDLVEKHPYSYIIYLFLLKKREANHQPISQEYLARLGLLTPSPMHTSILLRTPLNHRAINNDTFYSEKNKKPSTLITNTTKVDFGQHSKINRIVESEVLGYKQAIQKTRNMRNDKDTKQKWTPFEKMLNAFFNIGKKTTEKEIPKDAVEEVTIEEIEVNSDNGRTKVKYIEETRIKSDNKIVESTVTVSDKLDNIQVEELADHGETIILGGKSKIIGVEKSPIPSNMEDVKVSSLAKKVIDLKNVKKEKKKKEKKKETEKIKKSKKKQKNKKDRKLKDSKTPKDTSSSTKRKKSKKKPNIIEAKIKESTIRKEGIGSETLAKLMIQQGKIEEAKKIFQELMMKYPEKSTYFANLIKNLK